MEVILTIIKNHVTEYAIAAISCLVVIVVYIRRSSKANFVVTSQMLFSDQEPDAQDLEKTTIRPSPLQPKSGKRLRRVAGPAVAAFNAQMEAEEVGKSFTPEQWVFPRSDPRFVPEAEKTAMPLPPAPATQPMPVALLESQQKDSCSSAPITQPIPVTLLENRIEQCKVSRPLAHTRRRS